MALTLWREKVVSNKIADLVILEVGVLVRIDLVELQDEAVESIAREQDVASWLPHLSCYVVPISFKVIDGHLHLQLEVVFEMRHLLQLCKCF